MTVRNCSTCGYRGSSLEPDTSPCRGCFGPVFENWVEGLSKSCETHGVYFGHKCSACATNTETFGLLEGTKRTVLPTTAAARKSVPLFSGLIKYFPQALAAVAELSRIGNEQHNPGQPLHWDRSKSTDELDALTRHLFEAGAIDTDTVRHSAKVAWRALANLEKELEASQR